MKTNETHAPNALKLIRPIKKVGLNFILSRNGKIIAESFFDGLYDTNLLFDSNRPYDCSQIH
jgi:hypothetical protein